MPRVSGVQVARWAAAAGFTNTGREDLNIAVAVARGESGWNTSARNHSDIEDSRGLWQINVWAHPWGKGINLYDGKINAEAARRVFRQAGNSWRPWTVYTRGIYKQYLVEARSAVKAAGMSGGTVTDPQERAPSSFEYWRQIDSMSRTMRAQAAFTGQQRKLLRRYTGR